METILKMDEEDAKVFLKWYLNHPYRKGIVEVLAIISGRSANTEVEGACHTRRYL